MSDKLEKVYAVFAILVIIGICLTVAYIEGKDQAAADKANEQEPVRTVRIETTTATKRAAAERASLTITCTNTPTATPQPTATNTPTTEPEPSPTSTPTNTPKPTKKPTPKPTKEPTPKQSGKASYGKGMPGTYKAEANGTHAWKPWTNYTSYTAKSSQQYKLQQIAKTDGSGRRYCTDPNGIKRFCIALGTAWAGGSPSDIGRCIDVKMKNGEILRCVLADVKKVEHSQNGAGKYGHRGELLEFIVDKTKLEAAVKNSGNCSSFGGAFTGEAVEVRVLDLFISGFGG